MRQRLFYTKKGYGDEIIVWLHGLWGGGNYYREFGMPVFTQQKFTQIFPDELGFGKSQKPKIAYTPQAHAQSLSAILPLGKRVTLIGFSLGSILALEFAKYYPERVKNLVLICPPFYKSRMEAVKYLSKKLVGRHTLHHPFFTMLICKSLCATKLLSLIVPIFAARGFKKISMGCTNHTWHSYYSTFNECFLKPSFEDAQDVIPLTPTLIIYGDNDTYLSQGNLEEIRSKNLKKIKIGGAGHDLFFTEFENCQKQISKFMRIS